jgi:hypothetical protein
MLVNLIQASRVTQMSMVCLALVLSIVPVLPTFAGPGAGLTCDHWGENARNVLADYRIRVESGMTDPQVGTKDMVSYENMAEGKTGKRYYDTIFPKIFALASPEEVYLVARDFCESMPDDAFLPENFY